MSKPQSPFPLPARLAVTLLAPLAIALAPTITLPGVDAQGLAQHGGLTSNAGLFALGIMPFVSASILVELAALLRPKWRALRHGGPAGRAKLGRATLLVTLVLCLFQGYGISRLLQALPSDVLLASFSEPLVLLSLTAGTFVLGLVAHLAGVYGLAGGFAVLAAALPLSTQIERFARSAGEPGRSALVETVVQAAVAAGAALITWYALRAPAAGTRVDAAEPTYREAPARDDAPAIAIGVPASGTVPLAWAGGLLAFPVTLAALTPRFEWIAAGLSGETIARAASLILIAVFASALTHAFNAPARIAALGGRAREVPDGRLEAEARTAVRPAIARTLVFLVALFALGEIGRAARRFGVDVGPALSLDVVGIAVATALALDVVAEWRARRIAPDLVPIWPEHRPYAIAAAREALGEAGITLHARGERMRRMLQLFGPYVPIDLMVPRADAERAKEILERVLLASDDEGEETLERALRATEGDAREKRPRLPAGRKPFSPGEMGAFAAAALIAGAVMLLPTGAASPPPRARVAHVRPDALQLLAVDDEANPFWSLPTDELPAGVSLSLEEAPNGPGKSDPRRFARATIQPGESLEQARARLAGWSAQIEVPAGDRVLLAALLEYDEEKDRAEQIGWRTYLVKGPPIIDASDIVDAKAEIVGRYSPADLPGAQVLIELGPAGAERFRVFTAANIKRRLAVVVDGKVESAPVINSQIPGGRVVITMAAGPPDQQLADAKRLAKALLGQ